MPLVLIVLAQFGECGFKEEEHLHGLFHWNKLSEDSVLFMQFIWGTSMYDEYYLLQSVLWFHSGKAQGNVAVAGEGMVGGMF